MVLELDKKIYLWQFWLVLLLIVVFILWIFYGGEDHEYIGLTPLKIGVNAADYIDEMGQYKTDKSNNEAPTVTVEPVDLTPELPDLSHSKSYDKSKSHISDSYNSDSRHSK